jgi:23S rRNA (guanosine2251-2'-O)-methyltransferase
LERVRLYGFHAVREALRAQRRPLHRLLLREGPRRPGAAELARLAAESGLPVTWESEAELSRGLPQGAPTQGFVLEGGPLPEIGLEELLGQGEAGSRLVVLLDAVEDPQNVGAILRAADAAGATGLLIANRRSPPLGAAVARASAGAVEWLPIAHVVNLPRSLRAAREQGFWLLGLDPDGENLFSVPDRVWEGDLVLALGAEGRGLRPGVRKELDHCLSIPMQGRVASLNVGAAAAVGLFEVRRRRGSAVPAAKGS